MPAKKLIIFYFSGTGNSENVAKWMASVAVKLNWESSVYPIARITQKTDLPETNGSVLLFVSPVHGFNYPPVMLKFIARFPKGKNKVILMNTRAGVLIGKYNLPGLSGVAFLLSSLILKIKGYSIAGIKPVDLPSNWMSLHPSLSDRAIKVLHERQKARATNFGEKVLSGQKVYTSFPEWIIDILISPVALGYYLAGRFMFAKTFYASGNCNNCDLCIKNCPVKAIIKVNDKPFWTFKCESCMRCMSNCPKKSIETAHGFILAYSLFSVVLTTLFFKLFNHLFFTVPEGIIHFAFETVIFLLFLSLFYRIVHLLMRFKIFERIMVYTSLTKYKFWGKRYKALKNF